MSRPLRLEYPGALWHVTSRGNERKAIYADDDDRIRFLEILGETVAWAGWKLHAFVLMGNHYHLLVETPEPTLSRGMRQLNGVYTQAFNRRHRRSGHLFQGRFKGILVEKEAHLCELIRYVVRNPVRAKLCGRAQDWRWSSYRATAGTANAPSWLHPEWTWKFLNRASRPAGQAEFRRFVNQKRGAEYRPWSEIEGQIYLGGDKFIEAQSTRAGETPRSDEIPRGQRLPGAVTMDELILAVAREAGVDAGTIRARGGGAIRALVSHLARACRVPQRAIGAALGINPRSVSKSARQGGHLLQTSPVQRNIWSASMVALKKTHPSINASIPDET